MTELSIFCTPKAEVVGKDCPYVYGRILFGRGAFTTSLSFPIPIQAPKKIRKLSPVGIFTDVELMIKPVLRTASKDVPLFSVLRGFRERPQIEKP